MNVDAIYFSLKPRDVASVKCINVSSCSNLQKPSYLKPNLSTYSTTVPHQRSKMRLLTCLDHIVTHGAGELNVGEQPRVVAGAQTHLY